MIKKDRSTRLHALSVRKIERSLGKHEKLYKIEYHDLLASTNDTAKEQASLGAVNGKVIIADTQSLGRGRMGRSFYSPAGTGIYMSVILRPEKKLADTAGVTAFCAVCVCDAIDSLYGVSSQIKWVNDVMLDGKKVCGILAEGKISSDGSGFDHIILGIGVNVSPSLFPEELADIAAPIEKFSDERPPRARLISAILKNLSPLLSGELPDGFMDAYRVRSLFLGKEVHTLSAPTLCGVAESIDGDGALLIRTPDGELHRIVAGEVSVRAADS